MSIKDAMLIPALIGPLVAGWLMWTNGYGPYYFLTNLIFDLCFGLMEWLSVKNRKKSISKDIARTPNWLFWTIIATWIIMQTTIALHWILMR